MYINFHTDSFLAAHFMAKKYNHKVLMRDLNKLALEESDTLKKSYYQSLMYYLSFPNQRNDMLRKSKFKFNEEI
jgi:hypothetical protein